MNNTHIPSDFIKRRLHSITGLFLVLFLIEHLFLNSQAALFIGEDGKSFIDGVNSIHDLPYLPFIEIFLLGVPIVLHAYYGVIYLFTSKQNAYGGDGSKPTLPYPRNQAYTWQRITSWILLVGIAAHVIHMRFVEYPTAATKGTKTYYMVPLNEDSGLRTLGARLGFNVLTPEEINLQKEQWQSIPKPDDPVAQQTYLQEKQWIEALRKRPLTAGQVVAIAPSFGTAELLIVRETFKMPLMLALYTLFVLAACFHAFNGLWTFLISWGITLTAVSQRLMLRFAQGLMCLIAFLGLAAIWGTYWLNLKQ